VLLLIVTIKFDEVPSGRAVTGVTAMRSANPFPAFCQNLPELKTLRKSVCVGRQSKSTLQDIADALIADGYLSLDAHAKALGVCRSTAWNIVKAKHKLGRLNVKTTQKILANPETPTAVRDVIEKYLIERSKLLCAAQNRIEEQTVYP
jgi:hypothetical protein